MGAVLPAEADIGKAPIAQMPPEMIFGRCRLVTHIACQRLELEP
jgi:hypothetical protein